MNIRKELLSLRPSDIITSYRLARNVSIEYSLAQDLLVDLVNEGILSVVIVVGCVNDEYSHSQFFYSFDDYYAANGRMCKECEQPLDFNKAKIGFRRGNY